MNKLQGIIVVSLALSLLSACSAQVSQSRHFGTAVHHNQYVQVYNPNAATGEERALYLDGQKAESVIEGYRKEKKEIDVGRLLEDMSSN